MSVEVSQQTTA